jgi:3-oxoacyl-[acyl-carrier protein] reductase
MTALLTGKTALVTGASRGIGSAIAKRLALDGARVIAHYGASEAEANALAQQIQAAGGTVRLIQADLAQPDAATRLGEQVKGERLDILVNNAGVAPFADLAGTDEATFDRLAMINMRSLFFITQKIVPQMNDGGRIINLSSVVTRVVFPGIPAYAATKGFVDVLTLQLAGVLGARGITVNAVAPGAIDTEMSAWIHQPGGSDTLKQIQALPGIGKPEHVADLVAFLASPQSSWITGRTLDVSGGTKL